MTARREGSGDDQPVWINRLLPDDVAARIAHAPDGPLSGITFGIKDNIDLAGLPTTAACPALDGKPAESSATAVQRLLDAGAVPVGKTNMDQFATGLVGTRTPYGACSSVASAAHVSGGSSSGSAVAVASGQVPLALGTDTAGSGRVPAAFNGIVGVKPTRGLVSTRGLLPACRSLDCVTTFTRTVAEGRRALDVLAAFDPDDPGSRPRPARLPDGVARRMQVLGVPSGPLDLDGPHRAAWEAALVHARGIGVRLVEVDVTDFLAVARLLYAGPWVAERYAAVGHLLEVDGPHLDPSVRSVILPGARMSAVEAFGGFERLAALRRRTEPVWADVDALLLPVTPGHPTHAEVAADPIGVNSRLGTYTNFVNLLDLCAVAVPARTRPDGLPFGVQLLAPAFADTPLLDLAARWCGEPEAASEAAPAAGTTLLAVAGAHLSGLPLNGELLRLGGRLHARARTGSGYRLFRLPGTGVARPGLVRTGDGPADGIAVEVWELPHQGVGELLEAVPAPLGFGRVALDDGTEVLGFLAEQAGVRCAEDVSGYGGWRAYLAAQ